MHRFAAVLVLGLSIIGCDKPQAGSPGLEPPSGSRDGGAPVTPGSSTGAGGRVSPPASGGTFAPGTGGAPTGGPGTPGDSGGMNPEVDADAGSEAATSEPYFLGFWVIDQPAHALYEATLYEFASGGVLNVGSTELLGSEPWPGFVTGSVSDPSVSVRCDFEAPWRSPGPRELLLDASCTDSSSRTVTLTFPTTDPATGLVPNVVSVDGESGWMHPGFAWQWRKCPSRADCMPF